MNALVLTLDPTKPKEFEKKKRGQRYIKFDILRPLIVIHGRDIAKALQTSTGKILECVRQCVNFKVADFFS